MSREERKMAQIIASIERMEQETRAGDGADSSSRSQEPHDAAKHGVRGKKGKKNKSSGVKFKAGKRLRVTAIGAGVGGAKGPFERKLTPKKRWIQLWSAQQDSTEEKDASSSSDEPEREVADRVEKEQPIAGPRMTAVDASPVSAVKVAPTSPPAMLVINVKQEEAPKIAKETASSPKATVGPEKAEKQEPVPAPIVVVKSKLQEQITAKQTSETSTSTSTSVIGTSTPKLVAVTFPTVVEDTGTSKASSAGVAGATSSSELRVKTPLNNESSHLSPPLERNSPTTTASISPSAKVKDSDTPNTTTAAAAVAKFSPAAAEQERPVVKVKKGIPGREAVAPKLERKSSSSSSLGKGEESYRRDTSDCNQDRGRKRSLERSDMPMSEEAKRRAERRRQRKTNWDVGDPRKGGNPVTDPPISAAAAAANQQSFAKYPPNRPAWRHSQSMMDMKPHFQSGHRSSSFYNSSTSSSSSSGARRGFHHATSLSQDRSRSAGRSSTRYSYGSSSTNSSSTNANGSSNYR